MSGCPVFWADGLPSAGKSYNLKEWENTYNNVTEDIMGYKLVFHIMGDMATRHELFFEKEK